MKQHFRFELHSVDFIYGILKGHTMWVQGLKDKLRHFDHQELRRMCVDKSLIMAQMLELYSWTAVPVGCHTGV